MTENMDEEIRHVIHYFYRKNTPAPSCHALIVATYGEESISRTGVNYWYNQFRQGRQSVTQLGKAGRPKKNEKSQAIKELVNDMPSASARYIAEQTDLSPNTVIRILKRELGLKKRCLRWVPKILNERQKAERVQYSKEMLKTLTKLNGKDKMLVVTCDESWFYLSYYHEAEWVAEGDKPSDIPKRLKNEEKIMFFSAISFPGLVYLHALPQNVTLNATYMCQHILPTLTELAQKQKAPRSKKSLILHWDNARPHIAKMTNEKIKELGWKKLPQPAYSPDISPNDFFLYGYIKAKLPYYHCKSIYELNKAVDEICKKIPNNIWENVYESWIKRLNAVIECGGEYPYTY